MTADVLPFPSPARSVIDQTRPRLASGDIVVMCVNATLGLWCAWPVAVVDDDGVVIGVHTRPGRMIGADRVNCQATAYGFAAKDHDPEAFLAKRWATWTDPADAVLAFAKIGVAVAP